MESERGMECPPELAEKTELEASVVLGSLELSARELGGMITGGELCLPPLGRGAVYLKAGGAIIAKGKLTRRFGKTYFKVTELAKQGGAEWK
jgi:hypothetical protein